ncbi:MAG: hypothetical protein V7K67_00005, partial [Nostoc sp.]|uniref:hypothetical protein n=1 Tax=Nostoc sp. TaxID=1180 RepID=UPI002FFCC183
MLSKKTTPQEVGYQPPPEKKRFRLTSGGAKTQVQKYWTLDKKKKFASVTREIKTTHHKLHQLFFKL